MFNWISQLAASTRRLVNFLKLAFYFVISFWKSFLLFVCVFYLCVYIIGFIFTFCILISGLIYIAHELCDTLLYNPNCPKDSRINVMTPQFFGIDYETHYLFAEDGVKIHTQFIKVTSLDERKSSPTIIYFHGNAGNIGHRIANAVEFTRYLKCNLLLVEYRGYGLSSGKPSESGIYKDAHAALKFIYNRNDICNSKIILFGRSLGGAVAIGVAYLAATYSLDNCKPAALIIENTFTSIPDIGRHLCAGRSQNYLARLFRLVPNWFYKNRYDSFQKISKICLPTLFISGLADELVPHEMMTRLFNCSASICKEMHIFESGTHNFTWKCAAYYTIIQDFIGKIFPDTNCARSSPNINDSSADFNVNEKTHLISTDTCFVNLQNTTNPIIMFHQNSSEQLSNHSTVINNHYYEIYGENSPIVFSDSRLSRFDLKNEVIDI